MNGYMWLASGLFAAFFINIAIQRFLPGLYELSSALEATLLVVATGVFIGGCLKLESRSPSSS
ncbi:hypothetical protein [Halomonas urumqiensis]|uniref:Uncharacterized protein n=1 Tax=Halomonas urumqiensis TaxID=1684789 RepID=A0A2N7UQX6_9GAMM|nr:hypothetical protein [Halomonas urumqiensis]PMR82821.1 hypothetical protein C1H70_00740 [Halomonas urumqiensis]PTB01860.1 hypothetical protein C6V82_12460 [Halomonas urumqiensis]